MQPSISPSRLLAVANGHRIPQADLQISFADAGFVYGAAVSEQLRTFRGKLFRLPEHLARLRQSAEAVGITVAAADAQMVDWCEQLVSHNLPLLQQSSRQGLDLGLGIFATPGSLSLLPIDQSCAPLLGIYTYPLPFSRWHQHYTRGATLWTSSVRQTHPENWPLHIKCRSRMHYLLAAQEAARKCPGAFALMLNLDDSISETPTANVVLVRDQELTSPPRARIFPGITLSQTEQLARDAGFVWKYDDCFLSQREACTEILLTSTPFCLLPVVEWDGFPVGHGVPGPVFQRLLQDWNALAGLDIVRQAEQFAA